MNPVLLLIDADGQIQRSVLARVKVKRAISKALLLVELLGNHGFLERAEGLFLRNAGESECRNIRPCGVVLRTMRVGTETLDDVFGKADVAFPVSEFQNINSAPEPRTDERSDRGSWSRSPSA